MKPSKIIDTLETYQGTQWISLCSYFTDDLNRYMSIYLMNHKSEILKSSKLFQSEDHRDKRINCLRYDHRDEYLSCELKGRGCRLEGGGGNRSFKIIKV